MKRVLIIMMMLAMITANSRAQNLSVANIEAQTGEETELVVNLNLVEDNTMTALQFNLALPEGMTLAESDVTLGAATNGHTLNVETLANGDHLFVLYSMNLNSFKSGELLRIPVKVGNVSTSANGKLYTIRTATADAVSHACADASFTVKNYELGDVDGDGWVSVNDVVMMISHILKKNPVGFNKDAADMDGDGIISVNDVTLAIAKVLRVK